MFLMASANVSELLLIGTLLRIRGPICREIPRLLADRIGLCGIGLRMARQVLCSKAGRKFFPSGDQDNVGRSLHRGHCRVLRDIPRIHRGLRKALAMETTLVTLVSAGLVVYLFWSLLRPESF